jgi:hypothetical protein
LSARYPNAVGPLETIVFSHEGREFQATMTEEGALKIFVTGRRNGKLFILPETNVSVTLTTEKDGPSIRK